MAVVSVGVQSQGKTVKETQSETNTRINAVTESIKALGVDNKDIQTSNYSMYPTYDYSNGTQRITGYQTNSTLEIKIRTIDKTNEVIDSATKAGANSVGGINFAVSDKTKAFSQARELAVSQAKQKASEAANTVGFRLGKIINYTESEANSRSPIPFSAMAKADSADSTQVEAGSAEIVLTVTLSYELE